MIGELTHFGRKLPGNCFAQTTIVVSAREVLAQRDVVERGVIEQARHQLADAITKMHLETTPGDYSVEYRLGVYVFAPDQFWQIVEEAARDIVRAERNL